MDSLLIFIIFCTVVTIVVINVSRHQYKKEKKKEFFDIFGVFPNDSNIYLVVAQKVEQVTDEAIKLMGEIDIKEMFDTMEIGDAKNFADILEKPFAKLKKIDEMCRFFGIMLIPKAKEYPGKV